MLVLVSFSKHLYWFGLYASPVSTLCIDPGDSLNFIHFVTWLSGGLEKLGCEAAGVLERAAGASQQKGQIDEFHFQAMYLLRGNPVRIKSCLTWVCGLLYIYSEVLDMKKFKTAWFLKIPRVLDISSFHICPLLTFCSSGSGAKVKCYVFPCLSIWNAQTL